MDHGHFDDLTRSLVDSGETRRAVVRLLAGGVLGGLVARLGSTEGAAARPKRKRRADQQRGARQAKEQRDALQAEGKRKKNHRNKPKEPKEQKPPQPPPDQPCSLDKYRCPDGTCVPSGQCCLGEKRCSNDACIPFHLCCPDQKPCGDIDCIALNECCLEDPAPLCGACEAVICEGGAHVCRPTVDCGPGRQPNPATCQCDCAEGWIPCGDARCGCYAGLDQNRPDGICDNGRCCSWGADGTYAC